MTHLWLVEVPAEDAAPGLVARLTGGRDLTVGEFAWSPDGRHIAFSASSALQKTDAHLFRAGTTTPRN
jgi:hypothetical protein